MKRILITGADGFIGSHLTEYLYDKGYQIRALAQYNSLGSLGWLENLKILDDIEVCLGDIRDPFFCNEISKGIDTVFHLAALIGIPYSYIAPQSYIETNITGTLNLCQAALENNIETFIQTSTSEVYGTALYAPIDEKHPMQPQSPYSASKIGSDSIAKSFFLSFDLGVCIARPFNTYGPRQSMRAVIPNIISQAINTGKVSLGSLTPTRDFNFVKDTCEGFYLISKAKKFGETFNIGSGQEISVSSLVEKISRILNIDIEIKTEESRVRPEKSEVNRLLCDNTKIRNELKYSPRHSLDDGLIATIDWFKVPENLKLYNKNSYVV